MQPHTPAALGFTTGLEAQCGVAAHVQPGAQTPASSAAAYSTPLTKVRVVDPTLPQYMQGCGSCIATDQCTV
jgi:hypothetical protein